MPATNLVAPLTNFIGRSRELAEIRPVLARSRLLTLTGAGGCGKTRLALQLASDLVATGSHTDGVWWVELAALSDPALVPQVVAQTLDLHESPHIPWLEILTNYLTTRHLMLVLDNCEHLLSACSQLALTLLRACPTLQILATSRERLGIAGEETWLVPSLSLPDPGQPLSDPAQSDAIHLFAERAASVVLAFSLSPQNAEVVAQVCRRLDGMPLAIELVAAWVKVLTVEQIARLLDDRFMLLTSGNRTASIPRHQTLRATLDWSYNLLTAQERTLFPRLSVFAGGFTLETAEEIGAGEGVEKDEVLEVLSHLVNQSLVVAATLGRSEARYHLLETIRQYAKDKLNASGEWSAIRDRHLQCFLKLTEDTLPKLSGPYQQLWLNWLESEYDNIRAALAWSLESARIEAGLRIVVAIYQFWTIRDYAEEGLSWTERLLAHSNGRISPLVHANALAYAVFLAGFRGNTSAQIAYGQKAAVLAEVISDEDKPALMWALAAQAYGAQAAGDYQTQFNIGKRVIQLNRELGDRYQLGLTLSINSFTAMSLGKYDEAHAMLDEALPLLREVGNPYRIAMALNFSGDLRRLEQEYTRAQTPYEESVSLLRELDAPRDLASALQNLAHTCLHLGDVERAQALLNESMAIHLAQQNTPGIAECLIGFAGVAITNGLTAPGARLLAAAVQIGGPRIASTWAATRMEYEHYFALARERLTEREFEAEQAAGSAFFVEQAIAYAQNLPLKSTATPATRETLDDLTRREREIVALVALGKSNGEIAEELVVSKRTIEKHIAHIILKLGARNRAQIVRWALETGLAKSTQ